MNVHPLAGMIVLAALGCGPPAVKDATVQADGVGTFDEAVRQTRERITEPRPQPTTEVAVLDMTLSIQAGELSEARLDSVRIVSATPPKVFARSRGDWEVRLQGRQSASYRIPSLLTDVEVENPPDAPSPYSQVTADGSLPFQLIVPLDRDGASLGVERIQIVDTAADRVILDTPLRR